MGELRYIATPTRFIVKSIKSNVAAFKDFTKNGLQYRVLPEHFLKFKNKIFGRHVNGYCCYNKNIKFHFTDSLLYPL